jgi:hypothetical protein
MVTEYMFMEISFKVLKEFSIIVIQEDLAFTVKSHMLGYYPNSSISGYKGMPQLIGTLFFPLLRACLYIRKCDSCYIPLKTKILEFCF